MISVIIVNWNTGKYLKNCIESLLAVKETIISSIIIVDNDSTDDSLQLINKQNPNIQIIEQKYNLGFSKACNIAFKYVGTKYVLFLNPDIIVKEGVIDTLLLLMEANQNIGIVGPQLINEHNIVQRSCSKRPTFISYILHINKIDRIISNLGYKMTNWDHLSNRYVDHVIGAFYLVKSELYSKLSGFDERYFLFMEDLDFSLKVKQYGYEVYYCADVKSLHYGSRSIKLHQEKYLISYKSKIIFAKQYFGSIQYYSILTTIILHLPLFIIMKLFAFKEFSILSHIRQYIQLMSWLIKSFIKKIT